MQINEVNSIRYLMREMDPSEEIEFEHEMMSDENLLIEVESLRCTYQKMGKLPVQSAPKQVLDNVVADAIKAQQQYIKESQRFTGWLTRSVAAAAVVILTVSTGYYVINDTTTNNAETPTAVSKNSLNPQIKTKTIQPWVDRNEVITVTDQTNAIRSQKLDQDYTESYNKLILVRDSQDNSSPKREILYTNSPIK